METDKDLVATEEVLDVPQKPKKKKTYSADVLAKKQEIARMALAKATEARLKKQREAAVAKEAVEQAKKAKLAQEAAQVVKEMIPEAPVAPPPPPEAPAAGVLTPRETPVEKVSKRAPKKTQVYVDSSDDDSDSDDFVLVRKKLVKKYREIKRQPQAVSHEISEEALIRKWQQDRYALLCSALTGQI